MEADRITAFPVGSWARETMMGRAFLVIDEQNECFTGTLPITHPAGHLDRILRVMDAAEGKIPTIVVQHHFPQLDKLD